MAELESWKLYLIGSGVQYAGSFQRSEPWHGNRTSEILNQAVEKRFSDHLPPGFLTLHDVTRTYDNNEADTVREVTVDISSLIFAYDAVKDLGSTYKKMMDKNVVKSESPPARLVSRGVKGNYYVFDGHLIWGERQMAKQVFWPMKVLRSYQFPPTVAPVSQNVQKLRNAPSHGIRTFVINSRSIETIQIAKPQSAAEP